MDVPRRSGLEILDKADAVLRALTEHGESSAGQIAEAVAEPVSSSYRLLASLTQLGFVERGHRRGAYRLSVDLLRLGGVVEDRLNVREVVVPELRGLLAATDATSFMCVPVDDRGVCVERLEGRDVRSLALALGQSLPLHLGAAPRALFANLPPAERSDLIRRFSQEVTYPALLPSRLEHELADIREQGFAISDGDVTPGIAAVGAPVFNHRGEVVAAISVSGLRGHILAPELDAARLVSAAAGRASQALGFQGEASA